MSWIGLGYWVYWLTIIRPADFEGLAAMAGLNNSAAIFACAVSICALPPMCASVLCLLALAPLFISTKAYFVHLLKRKIACEAIVMVPLSIILAGTSLTDAAIAVPLSWVLAYIGFRFLVWKNWILSYAIYSTGIRRALRAGLGAGAKGTTIQQRTDEARV